MNGMTIKQMQRHEFADALDAYRLALQTGQGIVAAGLRVHRAGFDRRCRSAANRVFKETVHK